jgi:hypothetical protein
MRNGELFRQQTLVPPIAETESGLSGVPTPRMTDWKNGLQREDFSLNLPTFVKQWPTPTSTLGTNGGLVTPSKTREGGTLIEALSARTLWPTPTVCGNYNRKGASKTSGDGLATAVAMFPTPSASHCETRPAATWNTASQSGRSLGAMARHSMWPTPCATDHKGSGKTGEMRDRLDYAIERGGTKSRQYEQPAWTGGQLNPTWVEWLMGWPLGWTDLKPLEMDKYQQWLRQHGAC